MNTCLNWHLTAQRLWSHGTLGRRIAKLIQYASQVILGCFIGCEAQIDPSVTFVHNGFGVVIHDSVSIASGLSICQ